MSKVKDFEDAMQDITTSQEEDYKKLVNANVILTDVITEIARHIVTSEPNMTPEQYHYGCLIEAAIKEVQIALGYGEDLH